MKAAGKGGAARGLLFGTAGTPRDSASPSTVHGIARVRELGLDCLEIEFVQGVKMGDETAARVREAASAAGIGLSCHAPYFVNLNAADKEKLEASANRVFEAARVGALCGATDVVFHPGFYLGDPPGKVYTRIRKAIERILTRMKKEGVRGVTLRPELTGKEAQFGSLDELIKLSLDLRDTLPCIDFSHYYARNAGAFNGYDDFSRVLEKIGKTLGAGGLKRMHVHLSGIQYGAKGELRHLGAEESGIDWRGALKALADAGAAGRVICESPSPEKDAVLFHRAYRRLTK